MWKLCLALAITLSLGTAGCQASLPRSPEPRQGPFAGAGPPGPAQEEGDAPWLFLAGVAAGVLVAGLWRWLALRRNLSRARARFPKDALLLRRALELLEEVHALWRRSDKVVDLEQRRRRRRPDDL
jgi:hypothetical protein